MRSSFLAEISSTSSCAFRQRSGRRLRLQQVRDQIAVVYRDPTRTRGTSLAHSANPSRPNATSSRLRSCVRVYTPAPRWKNENGTLGRSARAGLSWPFLRPWILTLGLRLEFSRSAMPMPLLARLLSGSCSCSRFAWPFCTCLSLLMNTTTHTSYFHTDSHAHAWLKSCVCRARIMRHELFPCTHVFVLTLFEYSHFPSLC